MLGIKDMWNPTIEELFSLKRDRNWNVVVEHGVVVGYEYEKEEVK